MAGIDPPVKVTDELVSVAVPPQVVVGVESVTTPLGKVSTSGSPKVATLASGLLRVMVSVETPPALMVGGLKDLLRVGGMGVTGTPHADSETTFVSIVTAPFCARALPDTLTSVVRVMLASARILPMNVVFVPSVAELPTCQNTLQGEPPLMITTDEALAVVRVLPIWNTHTALGSPPASRVSVPVNPTEDEKQ